MQASSSSQPIELCQQCLIYLGQSQQHFNKVQFLKRLAKLSNDQKYRKSSLFLYCLYCIISKYDYVEALEAIQKSQEIDQGSMMSISICKMIRALLYTYIDKHNDALNLMKQACSLMKSVDSISLEMKNHYKRMLPVIINYLNLTNGKKSFFKFFNQVYDQLAKQTSTNEINEEILYSIHFKIQQLRNQVEHHVPKMVVQNDIQKMNKLQKSKSLSRFNHTQAKNASEQNDYIGFSKPVTKEQKSINNIKKMIENQKMLKDPTKRPQLSQKGSLNINRKNNTKLFLKNQPNPYQINLYADEKPQCEFI